MMYGPVGLARLIAGYKFLDPNICWECHGRRGNVNICFLPDLLKIINEKKSAPKKVVLFGPLSGICLTELL